MTTLLTPDDLFLFNQGTHYRLYDKLGAHVVPGGTYFAVWAPSATAVSVIGDWNGWHGGRDRLNPRESSGIWEGVIPGIGHGARYKFAIAGPDGVVREKADPFAARAEHPPATASIVWQAQHAWGDAAWMVSRGERFARTAPVAIYEAHLGSWRRDHNEVLGYRELGEKLGEHLRRLGFSHVELMPVMEHPFYGSWGYQVTSYFAPTTRYGAPDDLMAMIDSLHQQGIGVIVDWVPAHFPTDAHGLGLFDGTHLFEHADPRRGFHPDWTSNIFNYGRHEVRSFLISSAMSWLDRYHVDGLRVDGVASMLYRDYSRKPGEWVPNEDGSNHDRDAIDFLQQCNRAVYTAYPDIQTIAEESTAWGGVSRPPEAGGLGFGYKWDLGWMHDTLGFVSREPIHRRWHYNELTFRSVYAFSENFVLPLSHDEVVHGKRSLLAKLPGDPWQKYATLRLLYGYQWTLPGKKLLFMGGELGVWGEWNHDTQLDWPIAGHPAHAGILRWLADLNATYRAYRALHAGDCEPWGFRWIVADDRDACVLCYARHGEAGDSPIVVVANFTPVPREGYRIGVPRAGYWRELLNSDAEVYGGSGVGNRGGMASEAVACGSHEQSLVVTAPPLAVVVFAAAS
ncbi:MAG TPA: 1,4-alpha-glucan branching protein GlgB [Kofleriaceae bacterium]